MKRYIYSQRGFTIVEILLVIALIALLATAVMPKIYDWSTSAYDANMAGVKGALQSAIALFKANDSLTNGGTGSFPTKLEAEAWPTSDTGCDSSTKGCFDAVLDSSAVVTDKRWEEKGQSSGTTFTYTYYKDEARTKSYKTLIYDSTAGTVTIQ